MKCFLCILTFLSAVCFIQGRSYGYAKKKIVKKPVVVPDTKLPIVGDKIGLDGWQNGQNWQSGVNHGRDTWENGQNWQSSGNWGHDGFINQGPNRFENGGFLNQGHGGFGNDGFLNQGQGGFRNDRFLNQGRNGGFFDSVSRNDVFNQGQGRFVDSRNNFDSFQNGQFGNQW